MKKPNTRNRNFLTSAHALWPAALALLTFAPAPGALADETCSSPYLARIEGQEEFVYVLAGDDNEQFLRAYAWDGKELKPKFALDFTEVKLGRPHHMLFGATKIGG
jgi:hypothetical protein